MTIREPIPTQTDTVLEETIPQVALPETHERLLNVELVLCHNPETASWKQAEDIEYSVFEGEDYVTTREEMRETYRPYEGVSQMIVAKQGETVVGSVRMMTYDENVGFKTINDAVKGELEIDAEGWDRLSNIDPKTVVEVGTLGLEKDYRTRKGAHEHMVTSLYGVIYARSMALGTPNIIASFDEEFFGRFKDLFGPAIKPLGPALDYMGSKTVPAIMNTDEIADHFRSIGIGDYVDELAAYGTLLTEEY